MEITGVHFYYNLLSFGVHSIFPSPGFFAPALMLVTSLTKC